MTDAARFWISTGIACLALGLSTLSLLLQRRDKRGRLVVSPSVRKVPLPIPVKGEPGIASIEVPCLVVHLANPGETPVNVRGIFLDQEGGPAIELKEHHAMYVEYGVPFTVEPQDGHDLHVRGITLAGKLGDLSLRRTIRVRVEARDELGRVHRSKPFSIEADSLRE